MKLYFENSTGEKNLIARPKTEEEAWEMIRSFCEEKNFKTLYYVRTWRNNDGIKVYDVGMWDKFFLLDDRESSDTIDSV